jgi:hypothetical protein
MKILRFVAICLNSIALLLVFSASWDHGRFELFMLVLFPLVVNLIYILLTGDSWLSLYFQRKVAEGQKRLA